MSEHTPSETEKGPGHRGVEIGAALFTLVIGVIICLGSIQAGIGWGVEGPRPGFFPFYISLFIIGASVVNLAQVSRAGAEGPRLFATWEELRRVLSVLVPTALYVALVPVLGIYVSSLLLIAVFMLWLGQYSLALTLPLAIGIPAFTYLVFERWFMIPLPKGPIEGLLGL